jgi:hypothetical protein
MVFFILLKQAQYLSLDISSKKIKNKEINVKKRNLN